MIIEESKNIFFVVFYGINLPRVTGASRYTNVH